MDLAYLRPRRNKPDPLPLDDADISSMAASTYAPDSRFGGMAPLQFDDSTSSDTRVTDSLPTRQQIISRLAETQSIDVPRLTDQQMQLYREQFDAEALKKASAALNITEDQYRNLIPIDFNAEALLKQTDDVRLKAREKMKKSVLKK